MKAMTQYKHPLGIVERIKNADSLQKVQDLLIESSGYHEASDKTIRRVRRAGHARTKQLSK